MMVMLDPFGTSKGGGTAATSDPMHRSPGEAVRGSVWPIVRWIALAVVGMIAIVIAYLYGHAGLVTLVAAITWIAGVTAQAFRRR